MRAHGFAESEVGLAHSSSWVARPRLACYRQLIGGFHGRIRGARAEELEGCLDVSVLSVLMALRGENADESAEASCDLNAVRIRSRSLPDAL